MVTKCLPHFSCWVQHNTFFYVTVVAVVFLILLCNFSIFISVLIQIRQMRASKLSGGSRSTLQDLRAVVGLTVLLGLTWTIGFFPFGPGRVVLMYLFTIFNSLQGKHELLHVTEYNYLLMISSSLLISTEVKNILRSAAH